MENKLISLYELTEDSDIDVDWFTMRRAESLSCELPDGKQCIAIDPWKMETIADETVSLAHELGHCKTGSFYNRYTKYDVIQKHENTANKWAIQHMISEDELNAAISHGHTEIWDLAEHFNVTEDFMRMTICWYLYGTLDTNSYFVS